MTKVEKFIQDLYSISNCENANISMLKKIISKLTKKETVQLDTLKSLWDSFDEKEKGEICTFFSNIFINQGKKNKKELIAFNLFVENFVNINENDKILFDNIFVDCLLLNHSSGIRVGDFIIIYRETKKLLKQIKEETNHLLLDDIISKFLKLYTSLNEIEKQSMITLYKKDNLVDIFNAITSTEKKKEITI